MMVFPEYFYKYKLPDLKYYYKGVIFYEFYLFYNSEL